MAKKKPDIMAPTLDLGDLTEVPKNKIEADFPINKIKPRPDPSRYYPELSRSALEDSIRRFGFTEPLILNPDFEVIHGNLRFEIAKTLGLSTVPVVILSKKSYDYHLFANRIQDWGMWNHAFTDLLLLIDEKVPAPKREKGIGVDWDKDEAKGSGKMTDRTALRKIGWFTNDVPSELVASSFTLEKVAEEIVSRERSKIYQFNPEQLLFVARTRRALLRYFENSEAITLNEKEMPKDGTPEKIEEKLKAKKEYYQTIAKDIREYDFDLNPGGDKFARRKEISEAIMDVLTELARENNPELKHKTEEEVQEAIADNLASVPARDFQKAMKSLSIFDILEDEQEEDES